MRRDWSAAHCEPTPRRARIGRGARVLHVEPRLVNAKKTVRARLRVGVLLGAPGRRGDTGNQKGPNSRCGLDGDARVDGVGGGGGMARMRLPYLCKLPESFARAREGNDEISGVTATMRRRRRGRFVRGTGKACGETFQTLLIRRLGGRGDVLRGERDERTDGRRECVYARAPVYERERKKEKKKNKIEETFCVIGKRSKRVFALV